MKNRVKIATIEAPTAYAQAFLSKGNLPVHQLSASTRENFWDD